MTLYRIYTENRPNLAELVSAKFDSFTIFQGTGYWKGQAEQSAVIEILSNARAKAENLARTIRNLNSQESVLVVKLEVADAVLVEANGNTWLV